MRTKKNHNYTDIIADSIIDGCSVALHNKNEPGIQNKLFCVQGTKTVQKQL